MHLQPVVGPTWRRAAIALYRRLGENLLCPDGTTSPEWRENTIISFQQAAALGTEFVEFDVQASIGIRLTLRRGEQAACALGRGLALRGVRDGLGLPRPRLSIWNLGCHSQHPAHSTTCRADMFNVLAGRVTLALS
jgi:hypothetical protein